MAHLSWPGKASPSTPRAKHIRQRPPGPGLLASPTRTPRRPHWCWTGRPLGLQPRRPQHPRCKTRVRRQHISARGSGGSAQRSGCHSVLSSLEVSADYNDRSMRPAHATPYHWPHHVPPVWALVTVRLPGLRLVVPLRSEGIDGSAVGQRCEKRPALHAPPSLQCSPGVCGALQLHRSPSLASTPAMPRPGVRSPCERTQNHPTSCAAVDCAACPARARQLANRQALPHAIA